MYISRIAVNPYMPDAREMIGDTFKMHVGVMKMFNYKKDESGRASNRNDGTGVPLWRMDAAKDSIGLYVVSGERPRTENLSARIGWGENETGSVRVAEYAPLIEELRDGQQYRFRLAANMTTRVGDGGASRLVVARSNMEKMRWVKRKADAGGFHVDTVPELFSTVDTFTKGDRPHARRVTLDKTTVDGVLTITDVETFKRSLTAGIGRGKAYGCGLMTLAPVNG